MKFKPGLFLILFSLLIPLLLDLPSMRVYAQPVYVWDAEIYPNGKGTSIPTSMEAGKSYTWTIKVENTGSGAWGGTPGNIRLAWAYGNQGNCANCPNVNCGNFIGSECANQVASCWKCQGSGCDGRCDKREYLDSRETVEPGGIKFFTINVAAPARVGTYTLKFCMVKEGETYMGNTFQMDVVVRSQSTPTPTATPTPTPTPTGKSWQIETEAVCANGQRPNISVKTWHHVTGFSDWVVGEPHVGPETFTITTYQERDYVNLRLSDESGNFLYLRGEPPHWAIVYWSWGTPQAAWDREELPEGRYRIEFQAPEVACQPSYCQINSVGCGQTTTNSIQITNITHTDTGWGSDVPGATKGMTIWRSSSPGGEYTNAHLPSYGVSFSSSYTDSGLQPNTTYWYRVSCALWTSSWGVYQGYTEPFSCGTAAPPIPTPTPVVESMMISNFEDFRDGVEESFATAKAWALTEGDGVKTVYAKFKWSDGRWTNPVSDKITLQTTGPTPTPTPCPTHSPPDPCPGSTRCEIMECFDCSPDGSCDWTVCSQYDYDGNCEIDILDLVRCNARCKTDGTEGTCCSSSDQCQPGLRCDICYEKGGSDPIGECVSEQVPTPTPTTPPGVTSTPTPAPTSTPTPTPEPGVAHLTFRVKFQGIRPESDKSEKTAILTLKKSGDTVYTRTIGISPDQSGIYTGRLTNIKPGTYDILIKGWAHLQKKFTGITLAEGENTKDWSNIELLTGNANGDGEVNILDFGILVENYLRGTSIADFNLDGQTNIQDFRFIAENYTKTGEE